MSYLSTNHYCTSNAQKMKEICLHLILICISTSIVQGFGIKTVCDDGWLPYKDEKCVRLFETFTQRNQAEAFCSQHDATLVAIKSADEQTFFTELVFNSSFSNSVWLGAERRPDDETEFVWSDGSAVDRYSNWAIGRPSADVRRTCVQMQSELSRHAPYLEWADIGCTVGNWFICEKVSSWSFDELQRAVLSTRREMDYNINSFTVQMTDVTTELNTAIVGGRRALEYNVNSLAEQMADITSKLNEAQTKLKYLSDNLIPKGFVYTQLPDQPKPSTIWEFLEWTEITEQYAGLFFRAVGGNSSEFGIVQQENSPRLSQIETMNLSSAVWNVDVTANGQQSPAVSSGAGGDWTHWGLSFTVSSGEVRPRNTGIRIWKRTN